MVSRKMRPRCIREPGRLIAGDHEADRRRACQGSAALCGSVDGGGLDLVADDIALGIAMLHRTLELAGERVADLR